MRLLSVFLLALALLKPPVAESYDVIVYGGSSSGVIAACSAARAGQNVVLLEQTGHVGGLTASGIGNVDIGWARTVGGMTADFLKRVGARYGSPDKMQIALECSVAEQVFLEMLEENHVKVCYHSRLRENDGVLTEDGRIRSLTLEDGSVFEAGYFIDASYQGDLMAQAGVSYLVGRESSSLYGESSAGAGRPFLRPVPPEKAEFFRHNAESWPLDYIRTGLTPPGESDGRTQAYTWRLTVTDRPENRVPFRKPEQYDPDRYQSTLERILRSGATRFGQVFTLYPLPNGKYDLNHMDLVNASWEYPDGNYALRDSLDGYHRVWQEGILYFLSHDPRVPEALREDVLRYGLARDEYADNGNWPYQIYIREGRRMRGSYVMVQQDAWDSPLKEDAVAIGSYFMDCHTVSRVFSPEGGLGEEGGLRYAPYRPYEISYRCLAPRREECTNLLVTVCLSASHVIYSSLRMEPVYMMLGQAAGTAIPIAARLRCPVQDVPVPVLQDSLVAGKQIIHFDTPEGMYLSPDSFAGVVMDNAGLDLPEHPWFHSTANGPFMNYDYRYASCRPEGKHSAVFRPRLTEKGWYEVQIMYSPDRNRTREADVSVLDRDGVHPCPVDMTLTPEIDGFWHSLGVYPFSPGDSFEVRITDKGEKGIVVVDAVRFLPVPFSRPVVAPMPEGEVLSPLFQIKAAGVSVPVYQMKVAPEDKKLRYRAMDDKAHSAEIFETAAFCTFDIAGTTPVRIRADRPVRSVKVLPASRSVKATVRGKTVRLDIRPGDKLTVEINGDVIHSLHLFANPPETLSEEERNDPNTIYFGPGVHYIKRLVVKDNQRLYLAAGAVLKGVPSDSAEARQPIVSLRGDHIRVGGRGILDGSLCPTLSRNLLSVEGKDIAVEGIILRDSPVWTLPVRRSEDVRIDNVKILGYRANSDGVDICSSRRVLVENCFIRTLDDLVVVKTTRGGGPAGSITVRKNILWNEVAHALSIGAEITADISDVLFTDNDIIHDRGREWNLRIYHCDQAHVRDVVFRNIRIAEGDCFISLWIDKAVWSTSGERGKISGVRFEDIRTEAAHPRIELKGFDETHPVRDVSFGRVILGDRQLTEEDITTNSFVKEVNIINH